jgi:hypothetical protein
MLKEKASDFHYNNIIRKTTDFYIIITITKTHFKTKENR